MTGNITQASFRALWAQWDSLHFENGLLKRAWESPYGRNVTMQLVVLANKNKEILPEMHIGISGTHFGFNKTLSKGRDRFYWVPCREDVESCCKKCTHIYIYTYIYIGESVERLRNVVPQA